MVMENEVHPDEKSYDKVESNESNMDSDTNMDRDILI